MQRLERDFHTQYEFVGNFLVNPIITFVIQPTRGFGDFDMFGTRYGHRLQNTKTCKIEANRLVFTFLIVFLILMFGLIQKESLFA